MTNQLTTIAALPGSGAGCMSSLPPEKHEQPVKVQMKSSYFNFPELEWPPIQFLDEEPGE